jgi:catechol 2,3-dioxygenase-like lactoylglutathione lyase family enzyme
MIDHTSLGVRDYDRAVAFYTAILAPVGYDIQRRNSEEAAFGTAQDWGFFLYPAAPEKSIVGERNHIAFRAPSREAVAAFNRIATAQGGKQVRPVGPRPDIGPEYFGTVLTDLDGHTLEAVFWDRT